MRVATDRSAMIRDARVLQDDHQPREIVHRHEEMNRLAAALSPVVDGDRPQHALLSGPSGAGKTCIARATLDRLQERVLDVRTAHVDCWLHSGDFRVLYELLERIGTTAEAAGGNARDAIGILRSAARRAERDDDIAAAIPAARTELRQKSLDRLSDHQLAVYEVLREGGELMPKEIVARYAGRVDEPRSKRTVRKYLSNLDQYNLIESDGRGPSRVYRLAER